MTELELKLVVPPAARAAVRAAVATAKAHQVRLRAAYVDTADERLAAHGFALRLRQEGPRWVQTLKGRGDGVMARLEHEVLLPGRRRPALDPARHAGTPAGEALARLLADGAPLVERYGTDIRRMKRVLRSGAARIELTFDEGVIVAGARREPVCEVELELLAGPPSVLPAVAARWALRHGLRLDVQTKSERGHRLALGLSQVPAVQVPAPRRATFARRVQAALAQLLPNAGELVRGGDDRKTWHQLQRAQRRLVAALAAHPAAQDLADRLRPPLDRARLQHPAFSADLLHALGLALSD